MLKAATLALLLTTGTAQTYECDPGFLATGTDIEWTTEELECDRDNRERLGLPVNVRDWPLLGSTVHSEPAKPVVDHPK